MLRNPKAHSPNLSDSCRTSWGLLLPKEFKQLSTFFNRLALTIHKVSPFPINSGDTM
jgi:hypothetical protein